jgi:hypothetical protein
MPPTWCNLYIAAQRSNPQHHISPISAVLKRRALGCSLPLARCTNLCEAGHGAREGRETRRAGRDALQTADVRSGSRVRLMSSGGFG